MRSSNGRLAELFARHPNKPILTVADWPYPANAVFNPGATQLGSGETLLLARVEDRRGVSHLTVARSPNGVTDGQVEPAPTMPPLPDRYPEERREQSTIASRSLPTVVLETDSAIPWGGHDIVVIGPPRSGCRRCRASHSCTSRPAGSPSAPARARPPRAGPGW